MSNNFQIPAWDDYLFTAFDFETSGTLPEYALQPWRVKDGDAWATSLVWLYKMGNELQIEGGLRPNRDMMEAMLDYAIAYDAYIIGWNTVFDIQWLLAYGLEEKVFKCKWLDGMLLWRHLFIEPEYDMDRSKKKSYGLKPAVEEFLPQFAGYADEVDFHATDPASLKVLHDYNIRDSAFTLRLTKLFWHRLLAENPKGLQNALIEAECLPMVAKANLEGMVVDTVATRELQAYLQDVARRSLEILAPHGVTEAVVRSPTKLATLMFDQWMLPVLKENTGKKTGKVSRATDKEVLHELSFKDERAKLIRLYREALNNDTKFAQTPLDSILYNGDGRTRPQAIVFGTYSGRLTYASKQGKNKDERQTGFALHQEKRGADFRNAIVAPPGYTIIEFDASGQEFRWMAIASNDTTMLQLCMPGEDPHAYMGAQVNMVKYQDLVARLAAEDKEAKPMRQLGKVANLSLQYRTSARKLLTVARVQYELPMELPQAQMIHTTYQRAYPGVPVYWKMQIAETKAKGYVETFGGRRVQVKGDWSGSFGWSMGSTAINYRIQGTGADQKYLAMALLKPILTEVGGWFGWDLHDGIYMFVPDEKVAAAVPLMRKTLNNLPYREAWGFTPPIPLPWDCKIGKAWGSLKEIKDA